MVSATELMRTAGVKRFIQLPFDGSDIVFHQKHGVGRVSGFSGSPSGETMGVIFPLNPWETRSKNFTPSTAVIDLRILMTSQQEQKVFGRRTFEFEPNDIVRALQVAASKVV